MPKIKDDTKQIAIREAALKLVIQTGFAGLKMADVAREAGMATGTVYIYYANKEELINELYALTKQEVAEVLLHPAHMAANFYDTFRNMWLGYFAFCRQKPEKMLFVEQFLYSGYVAPEVIEQAEARLEPLNHLLLDAQQQGIIKLLDVELLKAYIQGALHETIKILMKQNRALEDGELNRLFDMTWSSIRK
jgi:TetR/AcrR family transcriptional regulator, repressor of fatR-cypB operon